MRSSLISLSLFLSTISCGGNDKTCGTGGASPNGIAVGDGTSITLMFGGLTSSANNDCPGTNTSVVSLTVTGTQTNGSGFITLCFPHPDQLDTPQALGADVSGADEVHVVDVDADQNGCTFTLDSGHIPTGTAQAEGLCAAGTDPHGFALDLDGAIGLNRCCGGGTPDNCTGTLDMVGVTITGQTSVVPQI
jgi:hypothetical protein